MNLSEPFLAFVGEVRRVDLDAVSRPFSGGRGCGGCGGKMENGIVLWLWWSLPGEDCCSARNAGLVRTK